MSKGGPRVNEMIREREIRVIGAEGEQLGVMTSEVAMAQALEAGLDLVEVAPGSKPPVCRIMDYGKYKYEQKKKSTKSKGHTASLKEVKLRPRTDDHDLETKLKSARRFLLEGDKVKITVMFRGRELAHREIGRRQLDRVTQLLGTLAVVENPARMEGRFLSMILVPNREAVAEQLRAEKKAQDAVDAALRIEAAKEAAAGAPTVPDAEKATVVAPQIEPAAAVAAQIEPNGG